MKRCMGKCEGEGNECIGDIHQYHVFDKEKEYDWGNYWYCDKAAQRDRDMGFTVEKIEEANL